MAIDKDAFQERLTRFVQAWKVRSSHSADALLQAGCVRALQICRGGA